jgi:hypothetical protein
VRWVSTRWVSAGHWEIRIGKSRRWPAGGVRGSSHGALLGNQRDRASAGGSRRDPGCPEESSIVYACFGWNLQWRDGVDVERLAHEFRVVAAFTASGGRKAVATGGAICGNSRGSRNPWDTILIDFAPEGRRKRRPIRTRALPLPGQNSSAKIPRVLAPSGVGTRAGASPLATPRRPCRGEILGMSAVITALARPQ